MMSSRFAQPNLSAIGFRREIALLDHATVKMPQIWWQSLHQKFPFDLARNFAVVGESSPHDSSLCSIACAAGKSQRRRSAKRNANIPSSRGRRGDRGTSHLPTAHTSLKAFHQLRDPSPSLRLGMTTCPTQPKLGRLRMRATKYILLAIAALFAGTSVYATAANPRH